VKEQGSDRRLGITETAASQMEFHIFRDARHPTSAAALASRMGCELVRLAAGAQLDELVFLLLLAGELECALADAAASQADVAAAAHLTSLLAGAAMMCDPSLQKEDSLVIARQAMTIPEQIEFYGAVSIGAPEGFAYYALNPLDYADLMERLNLDAPHSMVIGVRSIGTTLSAVVLAKLRELGIDAERMTVRPTGHPYNRVCEFDAEQRAAIACAQASATEFIVCDEGPGRSGSSLLSVAEALETEGVRQDRIVLLCSHEPNVNALCARDASRRWMRYRSAAAGMTRRLPLDAQKYIGGGDWRRTLIAAGEPWPAVWPQMEPLQYVSSDGGTLLTFEGHGPYGAAVSERNAVLAEAGFGLDYLGRESGFGRHRLAAGRSARLHDLTPETLSHMARYCAWRADAFSVADSNPRDLESMAQCNFEREFGFASEDLQLPVERAAICDNRMAPQYWLIAAEGKWRKLDAAIHGDDHFFPGPCDIAWDLAAIVVEWELSLPQREFLLAEYRCASGNNGNERLQQYELAYAVFRLAWSKMAAASVTGTEEEQRLLSDYRRYRGWVQRQRWFARNRLCLKGEEAVIARDLRRAFKIVPPESAASSP